MKNYLNRKTKQAQNWACFFCVNICLFDCFKKNAVRNIIKENDKTMKEELPTPEKSVKEIENEIKRELLNGNREYNEKK